jgi:hypothetical protein
MSLGTVQSVTAPTQLGAAATASVANRAAGAVRAGPARVSFITD